MKMTKTILNLFLILLGLVSFLTACERQSKQQPAKTAGQVTLLIHAWDGYVREYEKDFKQYAKEQVNLDVEIKYTITSGLDSFISSIQKNGVHLVSPANDLLLPLKRENLIKPVNLKHLTMFNQLNPMVMKKRAHEIDDLPYAVPFNFGPYALAYNRDVMAPPNSYAILWDNRFKKRVSVSGVYDTSNIYMTALMLDIPKEEIFNLNDAQLAIIEEKLRELCVSQVSEFWNENLNPANYGNYDVGTDWGIGVNQINSQYGGNWGFVVPKEGATAWIDNWAITVNVTEPNVEKAVYAFIDFMISPRIQAQMARTTTYMPVNPYAGRYLNAEEKQKYYLTDPKFIEKLTLWQPLAPEVLKRYQETWQRAKQTTQ
jgi:putative spermidine/putrescine transport system substrate-binding protein